MNTKRLALLVVDLKISPNNEQLNSFINELKQNISSSELLLTKLEDGLKISEISNDLLNIINSNLKHFAETIKTSIPEDQVTLIHKYVYKIEWDMINNLISIFIKVDAPATAISSDQIILEKTLY